MSFIKSMERMPELECLKQYLVGHNGYIAGGCFKDIFTGKQPKDIDIFFRNIDDLNKAITFFSASDKYTELKSNSSFSTYKNKETGVDVQLIRFKFAAQEDMLTCFDFTVTKFAYWNGLVLYHKKFFEHLQRKILTFDASSLLSPHRTYYRIVRYVKYGFNISHCDLFNLKNAIINADEDEFAYNDDF